MSLSDKVKKKLLAASGGYCGNPSCHRNLFDFFETGEITNIEEFAHIIGQKEEGPRGKDELPLNQRDEFDNIILLCPTCHTIVDKNPNLYPKDTIQRWKYEHEESIKNLFNAPKCKTREEARGLIQPILAENKLLFEQFGPYSENAVKDQFATELEWNRICLQKIIPNNRKIESLVSRNSDLLTKEEKSLFIQYKIHREGFENNHLSGDVNSRIPMFPNEFDKIFI